MSTELSYKVCPSCGEEYLHTVAVCADCGTELVLGSEHTPEEEPSFPAADELVCIRAGETAWMRRFSYNLVEAGIAHRVEPLISGPDGKVRIPEKGEKSGELGVFVLPEDQERAIELGEMHLVAEMPELSEADGSDGGAEGGCPACGDPVSESDGECGSCGLVFG